MRLTAQGSGHQPPHPVKQLRVESIGILGIMSWGMGISPPNTLDPKSQDTAHPPLPAHRLLGSGCSSIASTSRAGALIQGGASKSARAMRRSRSGMLGESKGRQPARMTYRHTPAPGLAAQGLECCQGIVPAQTCTRA